MDSIADKFPGVRVPPAVAQKLIHADQHGATPEQLEKMIRDYLASQNPPETKKNDLTVEG